MGGTLDGVRVQELARYQAGPRGGMILSDLGAEVIKIEKLGGEETWHSPPGAAQAAAGAAICASPRPAFGFARAVIMSGRRRCTSRKWSALEPAPLRLAAVMRSTVDIDGLAAGGVAPQAPAPLVEHLRGNTTQRNPGGAGNGKAFGPRFLCGDDRPPRPQSILIARSAVVS